MESPLDSRSLEGLQLLRCSWDYRHVFHLPVFPDYHSSIFSAPPRLRIRQKGVNCSNLCQLDIGQHLKLDLSSQPPLNMALVNSRSVCNKTFILHDFFTCWDLDILFLTETWAGAGELSVFEELCPSKCRFISTLRSAGRGGGVAMVFKQSLKIQSVSALTVSSFEVLGVTLQSTSSALFCALIYRPPNSGSTFISEFSEFFISVAPLYVRMLLLGDFNIHLCCPGRPLVAEFSNILDSFGFSQHI